MTLKKYYNKKVKIVDTDDEVFFGSVSDYFYPEDNDSEEESIVLDSLNGDILEFYEKNIKTISIIA